MLYDLKERNVYKIQPKFCSLRKVSPLSVEPAERRQMDEGTLYLLKQESKAKNR